MEFAKEFPNTNNNNLWCRKFGKYVLAIWVGEEEEESLQICIPNTNGLGIDAYSRMGLSIHEYSANHTYGKGKELSVKRIANELCLLISCGDATEDFFRLVRKTEVERVFKHMQNKCCTIEEKRMSNNAKGAICEVCKQFDEYAAPSKKHNGSIRCYLHNG